MAATLYAQKGDVVRGPDGAGYRFTQDVYEGDMLLPHQVEAFGGAPEPELYSNVPAWLEYFINAKTLKDAI